MNRVSLQLPGFFAFGYFDFIIGIILNSALIMVLFLLGKSYYQVRTLHLILLSLLLLSSYYFISQIMFIWPKLLAAFFIMSGVYYQFQYKKASLAGILFGLAYWSHPYAVVFFLSFLLYNLIKNGIKTTVYYFFSFLEILPFSLPQQCLSFSYYSSRR